MSGRPVGGALPPFGSTMSEQPVGGALPPLDSTMSGQPVGGALPPFDSTMSEQPMGGALPPLDSTMSGQPVGGAPPPLDSTMSSQSVGGALPPLDSTMSGQSVGAALPPLDCTNIEVDSGMDYHESDEDQVPSGCVSITSSVVDYQYEHGRRYHSYSQGNYPMPNDETEQDRLDMHHQIFLKMLDGRLFLAPLDRNPPKRILDIGTGTGIWALDMAEHFPHAHVIGTDLSPIQPTMVLPNCRFEVDDAELEWTWPPGHFDFIHSRLLGQSIKNWETYLAQMFHHLKPGGYVELIEHLMDVRSDDGSYPENCALRQYMHNLNLALEQMGLPSIATKLRQLVTNAGFVDAREEVRNMPWGPWPRDPRMKEIGYWALLNSDSSFEAYGLASFTRVLGMTGEEARELCTRAQRDLKNKHIHVYNPNYFIVARKPFI